MNKVIDYNYHLPLVPEGTNLQLPSKKLALDQAISEEYSLIKYDWKLRINNALEAIKNKSINNANIHILDSNFINSEEAVSFIKNLESVNKFTALIDFRDKNIEQKIINWKLAGGCGIKFHPYLQKINENDYSLIERCVEVANSADLITNIDCSYGTLGLYNFSGVNLICSLSEKNKKSKIVALHFGGPKILDLTMIAFANESIFLDLSLSLSFWKGSTVWNDLAFSIKTLGSSRFLFGSDHPFISHERAYADFSEFSEEYNLDNVQICDILYKNSKALLKL